MMSRLRSERGFLRDASGRICILRGVNVAGRSKMPPFLPFRNPAAFDPLCTWGCGVVRFLVLWEALAPTPDEIDEDYLERVRTLLEAASARGLRVIVDLHQDLFARCLGGDGAPAWAVDERDRFVSGRRWFARYVTSAAVRRALHRFWRDEDGIQTAYFRALRRVMEVLREVDGVVGYDPWNEPMSSLHDILSGQLEHELLPAFYGRCAQLRDELDPDRLLFFEPPPLTAFGMPSRLLPLDLPGCVYAPHVYDAIAITRGRYGGSFCVTPSTLARHRTYARHHEVPLFIGEFGALYQMPGADALLEAQCRAFDQDFLGWTAWNYDPSLADWNDEDASIVDSDGNLRPWATSLVRPYPRALAGEPLAWQSGDGWTLRYRCDQRAPTELVVPKLWSPAGPDVEVDGGLASIDDGEVPLVRVEGRPGREITIRLHRPIAP